MNLRTEQNGRLRRISLAAKERRNVLDAVLAQDLLRELADAEADPDTGAILLEADGQVFCGGLDPAANLPPEIFTFGKTAAKPIVAAVQGVAISAGVALIANAHLAVAAQGSSFGLTDVREGRFHPPVLDAVAAAIGRRRTLELALTGRIFSAADALNWGLVNLVAPAFEFDDRATGMAAMLAASNPDTLRAVLCKAAW